MIAVVSSRHDETALALVARWERWGARLIDADDLVRPGWRLRPGEPEASMLVAGGEVVAARAMTGILMRRPCVLESELAEIKLADRAFVAAETNAFLIAMLARIDCPVLNRPTALSLSGPSWRPEQWVRAAAELGIPFAPIVRRVARSVTPSIDRPGEGDPVKVSVVGGRCLGDDGEIGEHAVRLAHRVGVELLAAVFRRREGRPELLTASPWPDLRDAAVSDLVLGRLRGAA